MFERKLNRARSSVYKSDKKWNIASVNNNKVNSNAIFDGNDLKPENYMYYRN